MFRTSRLVSLLLLAASACAPFIDGGKVDTADSGAPGWVGEPPGGSDTGEAAPCGETGICALEVVSATAECGSGDAERPQLDAEVESDGTILIEVIGAPRAALRRWRLRAPHRPTPAGSTSDSRSTTTSMIASVRWTPPWNFAVRLRVTTNSS